MVVSVKGLPQEYVSCLWHYDDEEIKRRFNIKGTKVADGYGCTTIGNTKFLYEKKTKRHIQKAITQLQATAEKILDMGQKIDIAFILCERISKPEKSTFERRKIKGQDGNFLWDMGIKKPVELKHKTWSIPVKLFYKGER